MSSYISWLCQLTECMLSHVQLFVTLWTVSCQVPLSMRFSGQEYWSGLPFPSPGIFWTQGLNPCLLHLLHCRWILYCLSQQGSFVSWVTRLTLLDLGTNWTHTCSQNWTHSYVWNLMFIYIYFFQIIFPCSLLQNTEYISLSYTVSLSI